MKMRNMNERGDTKPKKSTNKKNEYFHTLVFKLTIYFAVNFYLQFNKSNIDALIEQTFPVFTF